MFRPAISPHEPETALIACDMTGAYITRNSGKSWREFNLRTVVNAIAFDPVRPNVIYAGSSGIFRSDDRGDTWRLVFPNPKSGVSDRMVGDHAEHSFTSGDNWPGAGAWVYGIRVDPANTDHIYAAISTWGALSMYYTTNAGETWSQIAGIGAQTFRTMFIDPASEVGDRRIVVFTDKGVAAVNRGNGTVTLVTAPVTSASGGHDPASGSMVLYMTTPPTSQQTGVWKAYNGGRNWEEVRNGLAGQAPSFGQIAVAERNPQIVYIAANDDSNGNYGILKTEDGGNSWNWVLPVRGWRDPVNKAGGWLDRIWPGWAGTPYGLAADATGRVVYATDSGTAYRTADGGATWESVYSNEFPDGSSGSRGLDVTTTYGVHFDPFDKNHRVISYTDIGLFHSTNAGESWKVIVQGPMPRRWQNTCYWLAFDPEVKNRAWSVWGGAHDLPRPKMFKADRAQYYVGGVCKTDDPEMAWQTCSADLGATTHILIDPKSPAGNRTLYASSFGNAGLATPVKPGGVFKSTDDGQTWNLKANGLGDNKNAWQTVMLPDGTLYLLVARGLRVGTTEQIDGGLYRSIDGAENWEAVPMPSGANAPNDLVFDPSDPNRMYLACWPKKMEDVDKFGGLYMTEDAGGSWRSVFNEGAHVYGVAVDPDNPSTLFINTFDSAAYRSDDRGATWQKLGGYNFKWGHRPVLDPHNKGMIYLTTFGSSVWWGPATGVPGALEDIHPF